MSNEGDMYLSMNKHFIALHSKICTKAGHCSKALREYAELCGRLKFLVLGIACDT